MIAALADIIASKRAANRPRDRAVLDSAQADGSVVRDTENASAQDDRSVVHGTETWFKVRVTAVDCPRISAAFLEEQRSAMGIDSFRQEHMCEFIGSGFAAFDRDLLEAALDDELELI